MVYIAIGCIALAVIVWASRGGTLLKGKSWRVLAGVLGVACFAGAVFVGMRGGWGKSIVLVVVGLWLVVSARRTGLGIPPVASRGSMSLADARSVLGVGEGATPAEIKAAHARLMRMAHPDAGGTDGLASQLNAARDRLLRG